MGKFTKKDIILSISFSVLGILLVVLDQWSKVFCKNYVYNHGVVSVIDNFFRIDFVKNTGAAWGIFSNSTLVLGIFSVLVAALLFVIFLDAKPGFLKLSLILIVAGAVGNAIDRFVNGFVIDFFSFYNIFGYSFPVFNVADICVTAGAIGFFIFLIFMTKKNGAMREGSLMYKLDIFGTEKSDKSDEKISKDTENTENAEISEGTENNDNSEN